MASAKTIKAKAAATPASKPVNKTAPAKTNKKTNPDYAQGVLDGILETVGDGGAQLLGSDGLAIKIKGVISTQCPTIDAAIGRGGIPLGRLTILHGSEGSGKTTLALHIVAEAQRMGGVAVYLDKEYKLDPEYAANLGVDTKRLVIAQPPYLERAFQTFEGVIKRASELRADGKRVPILIVLDSMNAAITKAQYEGEWDDKHMAPQARVYSELLPKLMPQVSREDVALLWVSQVRKKMNVMWGDDEEVAGGNAPKFYASLIMNIGRRAAMKSGDTKVGNKIEVLCKKNQIAPPFRKGVCEIVYGEGINQEASLIEQAVADGVCLQKGAFYSHNGENIGQGMAAASKVLKEHPEWAAKILKEIEKKHGWNRTLL